MEGAKLHKSVKVKGQGFRNAEPCFFVQGQGGMVVSGNLKDYPGNIFLFSHIQKQTDHGSAQTLSAKGRKNFHLMKTDAALSCPGGKKGSGRTV